MTDDLTKKLQILVEKYDAYSEHEEYHVDCDRTDGHLQYDDVKLLSDIKQAFIDDGWHKDELGVTANEKYMLEWMKSRGYMTGQEWYDKFAKESSGQVYVARSKSEEQLIIKLTKSYLDVAKRAAGISEDKQ